MEGDLPPGALIGVCILWGFIVGILCLCVTNCCGILAQHVRAVSGDQASPVDQYSYAQWIAWTQAQSTSRTTPEQLHMQVSVPCLVEKSSPRPIQLCRLSSILFQDAALRSEATLPGQSAQEPISEELKESVTARSEEHKESVTDHNEPMVQCVICMDLPSTVVVMSCGHGCMCLPCALMLRGTKRMCPLCRADATSMAHVLDINSTDGHVNAVHLFGPPVQEVSQVSITASGVQ